MKNKILVDIDASTLNRDGYCLCKGIFDRNSLLFLRQYLIQLMNGSLPAYHPIEEGCANFYRLNFNDSRSKVPTNSIQFNFFPWNQDFFAIFENYSRLFEIRNQANELIANGMNAIGSSSEGLIHRLAVQYYPSGGGYLSAHSDPVGDHQIFIANIVMSECGSDYHGGGLFIKKDLNSEKVYVEQSASIGDVVLFRGDLIHGVDSIDSKEKFEPLAGRGRWMMLSALTKPSKSNILADAKVYE